jgi:crotonobetainyl-CoA:carnitine CoA-transferase CaiB-like acyl-CoA transferase
MLLDGIRIISFCHYLQGPAAAQYLADMGADVIKVEPVSGAYERHWSGGRVFPGGVSAFFLAANRNKRSIALDLKHPDGADVARRLISTADVVMENFRPGVFERLGFGFDALKRIKPDIIYASATGYGASGPFVDKPGQDLMIQARTGLMSVNGNAEQHPTPVGFAPCDQHGAALLALGIAGALVRRHREGVGTHVEANLLNAALDLQAEGIVGWLTGGFEPSRLKRQENLATWFHQAPYGVYRTSDDKFVAISLNSIEAMASALADDPLRALSGIDPFEERDRIAAEVARAVSSFNADELGARFDEAKLWWAPVLNYSDLASDPQIIHNQILEKVSINGEAATLVKHPNRYDGTVPPIRVLATEVGQHSRNILLELGYNADEAERLLASGGVLEAAVSADPTS